MRRKLVAILLGVLSLTGVLVATDVQVASAAPCDVTTDRGWHPGKQGSYHYVETIHDASCGTHQSIHGVVDFCPYAGTCQSASWDFWVDYTWAHVDLYDGAYGGAEGYVLIRGTGPLCGVLRNATNGTSTFWYPASNGSFCGPSTNQGVSVNNNLYVQVGHNQDYPPNGQSRTWAFI